MDGSRLISFDILIPFTISLRNKQRSIDDNAPVPLSTERRDCVEIESARNETGGI